MKGKVVTDVLDRTSHRIGDLLQTVGGTVLVIMMLLTFADVMLRYFLNRPIKGTHELSAYIMAIIVSFGIAYCGSRNEHISVDLVITRLPPKTQSIMKSVSWFLSLVFFVLVTWQIVIHMAEVFNLNIISAVLLIPTFPFVAMVALGTAVFCLTLLVRFLEALSKTIHGEK